MISILLVFTFASGGTILGSPNSVKGGVFVFHRASEPGSLDPIAIEGHSATDIQFHVIETLLSTNIETLEWEPQLADHWTVSKDQRTIEFRIRKNAIWSDGNPVTADDVRFSFDCIFDPAYRAAYLRPYYEGLQKVEVVNAKTVRFHTRQRYFGNFISAAGLPILPKHIYAQWRGLTGAQVLVGSGPYKFQRWEKGARIVLTRNPLWWGNSDPSQRLLNNPEQLVYRFVGDENTALKMLARGDLDYMTLSPETFVKKAVGPGWGQRAFKVKVQNRSPKSWQFISLNLEREIFKDRRVRLAIAHLFDRESIVEKLHFGLNEPASGPWPQSSPYADEATKAKSYNPDLAFHLLKAAGWIDLDHDGILEKKINGKVQKLEFTILTPSASAERYLTVFQHDAAQVGVSIRLQQMDLPLFVSALNRQDFDAAQLDWGGDLIDFDAKPLWHSTSRPPAGGNLSGFHDAEVDRWIELARAQNNRSERVRLLKKIFRKIANEAPAIFLFSDRYEFYAYSNRVKPAKETYQYEIGTKFWWVQSGRGNQLAQVHR